MSDFALTSPQPAIATEATRLRPPVNRRGLIYASLGVGVVAVFLLELMIGPVRIPFADVVQALTGAHASRLSWDRIVLFARFPRALNALVSGAALGTCGLLLQTLFRNPLADPYVLGTVQGARLGVAVLVVIAGVAGNTFSAKFGLMGEITMAIGAAVGSTLLMLVLMAAARRVNGVTLLILGLMLGFLCLGLVSVVLHFTDEAQAGVFQYWDDGSFAGATRNQLLVLIPVVVLGIALATSLVKPLNALLLGEHYAETMGISVGRVRLLAFAATALLAGAVTAYSGPIAFLGLVVAHLSRGLLRTSDHRVLIPAATLMGGLVALTTDLVTHLPWAKHFLHLNAVNGLIGAPVVIWVILRRRGSRALEL
jgi:iron complex transport system permease protein